MMPSGVQTGVSNGWSDRAQQSKGSDPDDPREASADDFLPPPSLRHSLARW